MRTRRRRSDELSKSASGPSRPYRRPVPPSGRCRLNRGVALEQFERFDQALESYDRALAARPHFVEAHYNRGNALRQLKLPEEALQSYGRALAVTPDFAEALNNRGLALAELERFDQALESYDRAPS